MAAETFERALALVLKHEGGYVDHPADPGGATNLGITQATLARYRGRGVDKAEVRALGKAEAGAIYRGLYWAAVRADDLPPGIDLAVFDCAVNSGPSRAVRLLQRVLGVREDGLIGPETLAAVAARDCDALLRAYTATRLAFLRDLGTWPVFGRGWTSRVRAVERAALELLQKPVTTPPIRSESPKENPMSDTKSILASRTVWANLLGLAALAMPLIGIDSGSVDLDRMADALASFVAAASFIGSTVFRITAAKRLTG